MFNDQQIELFLKNLGLTFRWDKPLQGAKSIIVEEVVQYQPFTCWVTDLRTGEKIHSTNKFIDLCQQLTK